MRTTLLQVAIALFVVTSANSTTFADPFAQRKPRPYLGIQPEYTVAAKGVKIKTVVKDSPAARAGMKAGDIITKIGDEKITKLSDFVSVAVRLKIGRMVKMVAKRGGKKKTFIVVPISRTKR